MPPKLSFVIPVFNEAGNIAELHREIRSVCEEHRYDHEIIIVDDGSTDGTRAVITKLAPVQAVLLRKNFGQTAALDAGIKAATGELIVTMDGDRQNDPADVPALLAAFHDQDCDGISGWRKDRKDDAWKRFVSRIANFLRGILINDGIHDSGCSLKIYKRECFAHLTLYGEMHRFIPAILRIKGFRIGEIVVNHRPRTSGATKYDLDRSVKGFIDMISVWFWNKFAVRPLHLLGGLGLVAIFLGTVSSLITVWLFLAGQSLSDTVWPILSAFLLLTGIHFFIAGLLADMMAKTYYESTRDRPYMIERVVSNR